MSTIKSSAENLTLNADGANNDIKFQSNGSEVASIDQAGLVTASGIATTKLDTTATGITVTGSTILSGGNQMTDGISWYNGTNFLSGIRNKSNSSYNDSGSLEFLTSGTSNAAESVKMILNTQGVLSVPTGIELGSGLDATAGNTLDDYEEGNHTGAITTASGTITLYGAYNNLMYTKIGRTVTLTGLLAVQALSSPSGVTYLSLPFTCSNGTDRGGVTSPSCSSYYNGSNITDGHYMTTFLLEEGTSTARVLVQKTVSTRVDIGDQVGAGSDIVVALTYHTDA